MDRPNGAQTRTSILLVEENLALRERFYDLFTRAGYGVLSTSAPQQAMEVFKHERPNLVFANTKLSEVSGCEIAQWVRSFDPTTPVILFHTNGHNEALSRSVAPLGLQALLAANAADDVILDAVKCSLAVHAPARHEQWPCRILIVDDEPKLRAILEEFLALRGFKVSAASSGHDALEWLERDPSYTTVLLDVSMPGMDGLLVLKKIKASQPRINVIMLTGLEDEQIMQQALASGASDYIMKPFNFEYLETVLLSKLLLGPCS